MGRERGVSRQNETRALRFIAEHGRAVLPSEEINGSGLFSAVLRCLGHGWLEQFNGELYPVRYVGLTDKGKLELARRLPPLEEPPWNDPTVMTRDIRDAIREATR